MRILSVLLLSALLFGCTSRNAGNHFGEFVGKDSVTIVLNRYKLDSVPAEIGLLKTARALSISTKDMEGYTVYPPLGSAPQANNLPTKTLPNEICELKNLEYLALIGLNLKSLPDDFGKLENLEVLDLAGNSLVLSDELPKLLLLKKLKYLNWVDNQLDDASFQVLKLGLPGIEIGTGTSNLLQ